MSTKLTASIGELDVSVPLVFGDCLGVTLSSDYTMPRHLHLKGVYFKGNAAGTYTVVTLDQYMKNGGDAYRASTPTDVQVAAVIAAAVAAGDSVGMLLAAYQISECPVAFIESTGAPTTALNVLIY